MGKKYSDRIILTKEELEKRGRRTLDLGPYKGYMRVRAEDVSIITDMHTIVRIKKKPDGLNLYFDLNEFNTDEISDAITMLSELYRSIGGDRLIIKKSEILEPFVEPETVLI